ncbi:hypothetical protein ACFL11_01590, partial [Patescibacteria group bacterium]
GEEVIEEEKINKILEINKGFRSNLKIQLEQAIIINQERLNVKTLEGWEAYFDLKGDINWQLTELKLLIEEKIPPDKRGDLEYIDLRFTKIYYKYR